MNMLRLFSAIHKSSMVAAILLLTLLPVRTASANHIIPSLHILLMSGKWTEHLEMVHDHNPFGSSRPDSLIIFKGELYFSADNGDTGTELWKTNGHPEDTIQIADIVPTGSSYPNNLTVLDNVLYFFAYDGMNSNLWKSDGTTPWTVKVHDVVVDRDPVNTRITIYNGELYFEGIDHEDEGYELWKSNGQHSGTTMVKNINFANKGSSNPMHLFVHDGALYFMADDGVNGIELWKSDGTSTWTGMVKDICPGSCDAFHIWWSNFVDFKGEIYVSAWGNFRNMELWKSNGTEPGTKLVRDIYPAGSSNPTDLKVYDDTLHFLAYDGSAQGWWKSDGTAAGTQLVSNNFGPGVFTEYNGLLYFFAYDYTTKKTGFNRSDGTLAGTSLLKEINVQTLADMESYYIIYEGLLYFAADDGIHGLELWRTDGTVAGTQMVADINPTGDSTPHNFILYNNSLYFAADDGVHGVELWRLEWRKQ